MSDHIIHSEIIEDISNKNASKVHDIGLEIFDKVKKIKDKLDDDEYIVMFGVVGKGKDFFVNAEKGIKIFSDVDRTRFNSSCKIIQEMIENVESDD